MRRKRKGTRHRPSTQSARSARGVCAGRANLRRPLRERIVAYLRSGWSIPTALALMLALIPFLPWFKNVLGLGGNSTFVHSGSIQADHSSAVAWPSGTRRSPGQEDVFWKGSGDSRLWEIMLNNGGRRPRSVPDVNNVASSPAAAVNYWTGTDNQLWGAVWSGKWSKPHDLEMGSLGSGPSVAVWPSVTRNTPGQQDIFWKGSSDNRLWETVLNNGWRAPSSVPGVDNVASSPAVAVNAALDEEDIYWTGTDSHLWQEIWAGKWSGPYDLGMGSLGSAPALCVWPSGTRGAPGQEDVFWKGSGDSRLWEAVLNNGWQGPRSVPGVSNVASGPAAVINVALDQEDIYWMGTDGHLWMEVWRGRWVGPYKLGMEAQSQAVRPG